MLTAHCEAIGRDPADITKTRLGSLAIGRDRAAAESALADYARGRGVDPAHVAPMYLVGGPREVVDQVGALLETGLDGLIFNMGHTHDPDAIRLAGETLAPLLR